MSEISKSEKLDWLRETIREIVQEEISSLQESQKKREGRVQA